MTEALYRKYRPQVFEDVVGQEHIERTLKNAITSDKVSHAYLFTGPRGTGKTTTARLLAKALLCEKGMTPDPDGTCEDCQLIADGEHPDVYELDAASRTGVDNVREEIIGRVNYAPTRGRYKVYIIDEVHMLSVQAFNALLKTLEEPPAHVVFVLCTTDPQKVPETIHSRCQRFDFRRISSEELVSRLGAICEMEGVPFEGDALELVAHRAQGGMRDALTSLEQLIAFSEGNITMLQAERLLGSLDSSDMAEIVHAIGVRDAAACFRWTSEYMETGADLAQFTQDMAEHVRNLYVMSLTDADIALDVTDAARRELQEELSMFGPDRLARMLGVLADLISELKTSTNQRLSFEIALTRLVRPESDITMESLAARLEALESGAVPMVSNAAPARELPAEVPTPAPANAPASQVAPVSAPVEAEPSGQAAPVPDQPNSSSGAQHAEPVPSQVSVPAGDLQQLWESVLVQLKKISVAHSVLFMNARASWEVPGQSIAISFAPDNEFAFMAAQKAEAKDALTQALAQAGAQGMRFNVQKGGAAADAVVAKPESEPAPASQPVVEQAPAPEPEPTPVPEPSSAAQPVPESAPAPEPEIPEYEEVPYEDLSAAPAPVDDMPAPADAESTPTPVAPAQDDAADMNALLGAFGEGLTFTEVEE
ncbi:MAG: DNA polymerase III subunit gamma/tau [Eggerthellaceae bacterium]|nr:DNA polymerase III subunit gamma/tau [Eggerthellaceae bacterium]